MPYIHAAADLVVVMGPVNFMEPLMVQTPSAVYNNKVHLRGYNEEAINGMIEQGRSTGGLRSVKSPDEVLQFLKSMPKREEDKSPHLLPDSRYGKSPFEESLDQLSQNVDERLKVPQPALGPVNPAENYTVVGEIKNDVADNMGIYRIRLKGKGSKHFVLKIPTYQEDLEHIAKNNTFVSMLRHDETMMGAQTVGRTEFTINGEKQKAIVSELVKGLAAKTPIL